MKYPHPMITNSNFGSRRSPILNIAALACFALLVSSCAAIQARQKSIQDARSACYQLNPGDVYQEVFGVIASGFKIARESERRGFIETEFTTTTDSFGTQQQKRVNVEVMPGACVRVALRVEGLQFDTATNQWVPTNMRDTEDNLYLQIHQRVSQASAAVAPRQPAPAPVAQPAPAPVAQPAPAPAPVANPPGTEGGMCYGNGTCNGNLTCASSLCVRMPGR